MADDPEVELDEGAEPRDVPVAEVVDGDGSPRVEVYFEERPPGAPRRDPPDALAQRVLARWRWAERPYLLPGPIVC